MSVLSDRELVDDLISGHVVCRPLRPENVRGSSIDLTLGEYFWRCDARPGGVFNPYDEAEVERYFDGPFQAKPYASVYRKLVMEGGSRADWGWPVPAGMTWSIETEHPFKNIPEDWPVIVLRPRERILAHTHEFVGVHPPGTTMMKARSSSGRVGFKVCDDAGWGDPGYVNRWTMEMRNDNDEAIIIPVGERVAQLVFFRTGAVREHYGSERLYESKYQGSDDLDRVVADWTPRAMLPRAFKDQRQDLLPTDSKTYESALASMRTSLHDERRRQVDELNRQGAASVLD